MNDGTPRLTAAIPVLMTGKLAETVAFLERLGFSTRLNDGAFAIVSRDNVELHFGLMEGLEPRDNNWECRINVSGIDALYKSFPPEAVHPNGKLEVKPWGFKEFAALDPGGLCIHFAERA
jgi:hypothetical protein